MNTGQRLSVKSGQDESERDETDGKENDDNVRCGDGVKAILREGWHGDAPIAS